MACGVVGHGGSVESLSWTRTTSGSGWKAGPERVRAPYAVVGARWWRCVPEYHGTREILWEAGGTTLQG